MLDATSVTCQLVPLLRPRFSVFVPPFVSSVAWKRDAWFSVVKRRLKLLRGRLDPHAFSIKVKALCSRSLGIISDVGTLMIISWCGLGLKSLCIGIFRPLLAMANLRVLDSVFRE